MAAITNPADDIRMLPSSIKDSTEIKVPKSIRQSTLEVLGDLPDEARMAVVAQALHTDGKTVVKGAIYYRLPAGFTCVGYLAHDLKPGGLTAGVEVRRVWR